MAGRLAVAFAASSSHSFLPLPYRSIPATDENAIAHNANIIEALRLNVRRGDVLALMNLHSILTPNAATGSTPQYDFDWLEREVIAPILRPRGAALVVLGDSPLLSRPPQT